MSTQPSTVEVDGYSITSSHEDADKMLESLKPEQDDSGEARITVRNGEAVPVEEPKDPISEAASTLGKKGGEAAAAKRAELKAKPIKDKPEAKPEKEPELAAEKATADSADESPDEAEDIRKPSVKKRIETLARERDEAKQRADQERRERERLANEVERLRVAREQPREERQAASGQRQAASDPRQAAPQDDDPEPDPNTFEDWAEGVKAQARWAARQEFREQERKRAERAQAHAFTQRVQGVLKTYHDRLNEARAADPSFNSRVTPEIRAIYPSLERDRGEPLQATHVIADYIIQSEFAPGLLLHLSENPQDFQRIASLGGPREVQRAMARLEGRLDAATAGARVETEEVSQAKPPVRPVTGSPHTAADIEPNDDDDFDTHVRKMNAKEKRKSQR